MKMPAWAVSGKPVVAGASFRRLRARQRWLSRTVVASGDTVFTILHHGDDPARPTRVGEYFLEKDSIQLSPATPGRAGWRTMYDGTKGQLRVALMPPGWEKSSALAFRRAGVDAPDSE